MNKLWQIIQRKRLAYQRVLLGPDGRLNPEARVMMADLRRACGIDKGGIVVSPISRVVDSHASIYRAGQRDTYLRIIKMAGLDEAENVETAHERSATGTGE